MLSVNMIVVADSATLSGASGAYLGGLAGSGSKMFVGGLSWCTTRHSLAAYFGLFGDIEDCTVVTNEQVCVIFCFFSRRASCAASLERAI